MTRRTLDVGKAMVLHRTLRRCLTAGLECPGRGETDRQAGSDGHYNREEVLAPPDVSQSTSSHIGVCSV